MNVGTVAFQSGMRSSLPNLCKDASHQCDSGERSGDAENDACRRVHKAHNGKLFATNRVRI